MTCSSLSEGIILSYSTFYFIFKLTKNNKKTIFFFRVDFIDQFEPVPVRTGKDRSSAKKEDPHIGSSFEPSSIYKMLSKIRSEAFKVEGRQEDAEEFLSCLLNGLHDEMIELMKTIKDPNQEKIGNKSSPTQQPPATASPEAKPSTPDDEDWQVCCNQLSFYLFIFVILNDEIYGYFWHLFWALKTKRWRFP